MTGDSTANTTIVIPAWDRYVGAPLHDALASVTQQGVPVRVIVVDNASQIELPELGDVELLRIERRVSLGAARNHGLARVTTPYVMFWDADDVMLPGTLAFLEAELAAGPGLAAVGAAIIEAPSGNRHRWPRRRIARLTRAPRALALVDCVWSQFPSTGATIMRTELVRASGGYADADSGEDWCLGVSLAFRGRIGWSERPGRVYRLDPESVWARHMTARHQLAHAAAVRARLRRDRAVPAWVRGVVPLIGLAQYAAIAAHAVVAAARRARRARLSGPSAVPGSAARRGAPEAGADRDQQGEQQRQRQE